jgi:hypothetical protein
VTLRRSALAIALAVALALGVALAVPGGAAHAVTRAQLVGFEATVDPLVSHAGQVIQEGMKPALADLARDHVTPPAFIAHEADGWMASLSGVRKGIVALRVPSALAGARRSLVTSMDLYLQAAATFKAAALASPPARGALLQRVVDQASHADRVFDEGAAVIQRLRRSVGLGLSASFPDPAGNG